METAANWTGPKVPINRHCQFARTFNVRNFQPRKKAIAKMEFIWEVSCATWATSPLGRETSRAPWNITTGRIPHCCTPFHLATVAANWESCMPFQPRQEDRIGLGWDISFWRMWLVGEQNWPPQGAATNCETASNRDEDARYE